MRRLLMVLLAMSIAVSAAATAHAQGEGRSREATARSAGPPEVADEGGVLIYSDAANATVMIDGARRGQMPVSAATGFRATLPSGEHLIELRRDAGNRFYEFRARISVSIKEGALVPVTVPPLVAAPLPDAAPLVDDVVGAFLVGMATIPAGSYMMGGRDAENSADSEFPRHRVTIARPFLMQKRNATFEQWDACIADGGCLHVPDDEGRGRGDRPVFNVSWRDARAFAKWLSRRLDRDCHLPSEAQWEYATRGGTQTRFFFGDDATDREDYAPAGGHPTERQPRMPNPYGLFGMVGGVSQWISDCWQTSYRGAPGDDSSWEAGDCKARGVRGGFWDGGPWYLRSARRSALSPRNRYNYVGVRIACAMP